VVQWASFSRLLREREDTAATREVALLMTLLIDTGVVPARDRADFWATSSYDVYHPLQIRTDASERFQARMWGEWLASVGLFRVTAAPNTMSRTRGDIAVGDPECLHLSILLRGHLHGAQQQRECVLGPGDLTTYDTSEPAIFRAGVPFDLLVLKLPKATLGKHAAKVCRQTAVRIPGATGLPRLAVRFFCGTAAGLADGSIARHDAALAEHVIDLVRRLYIDLDAAHPSRPRSQGELLLHAQAYIDANLGDATLNPEMVARACFISTRYLHRVFAGEGLSVCEWIRTERLAVDLRDRQPVGPAQRAALQPPVPGRVRVLPARVPPHRSGRGRRAVTASEVRTP